MDKDLQLVIELDDICSGFPFCMPRLITQPRYVYTRQNKNVGYRLKE